MPNFRRFRNERAKKIGLLAEILLKKNILRDTGPLYKARSLCLNYNHNENYWGYYVSNLDFGEIESARNIRPKGTKHISLYLNLELDGICYSDEENFDPFKKLILDIIIKGRISQNKEIICCWHLNRHIFEEGDNEPEEVHPCYHLQFGGDRLLEWIDEPNPNQNILLIEPPRIPHPPLDIVLGVDFVLSNFYGGKWKNLREEIGYIKLVEEAQNLFWKSYSTAIASKWEDTLSSAWAPKEIWPQLVL